MTKTNNGSNALEQMSLPQQEPGYDANLGNRSEIKSGEESFNLSSSGMTTEDLKLERLKRKLELTSERPDLDRAKVKKPIKSIPQNSIKALMVSQDSRNSTNSILDRMVTFLAALLKKIELQFSDLFSKPEVTLNKKIVEEEEWEEEEAEEEARKEKRKFHRSEYLK